MSPLLLLPFFGEALSVIVQTGLTVLAVVWALMEPAVEPGEMPHGARLRLTENLAHDRLLWWWAAVVGYLLLCTLNTGVGYAYDIELQEWRMASARWSALPSSVAGFGLSPLTISVTAAVASLAVRNSFDRRSLSSFVLSSAALSGAAGVLALFRVSGSAVDMCAFAPVFGLMLLVAAVAVNDVFTARAGGFLPLLIVASIGNLAGLVRYATLPVTAVFLTLWTGLSLYSLIRLRGRSVFFGGVALPLVWIVVLLTAGFLLETLSPGLLARRYADCDAGRWFEPSAVASGKMIGECARSAWIDSPWIGRGLGTLESIVRAYLPPEGWQVITKGGYAVGNSWWRLLAEGGIVLSSLLAGATLYPIVEGVKSALSRFRSTGLTLPEPLSLLGIFSLLAVVLIAFFEPAALSPGTLAVMLTSLAVSARLERILTGRKDNG